MESTRNVLQRLDWRFHAARQRLASGLSPPRSEWDSWSLRLYNYLRRRQACRSEADRRRLACDYQEIDAAVRIRFAPAPRLRQLLEARILTGASSGEIAPYVGLTAAAVAAYETCFFDVRAQLLNPDLILASVISPPDGREFEQFEHGLKFIAFVGGSDALSAVLGTARVDSLDRLATQMKDSARLKLIAWANFSLATSGSSSPQGFKGLMAMLKDKDVIGEPVDRYAENVEAMLREIPRVIRETRDPHSDWEALGGIELRPQENMILARARAILARLKSGGESEPGDQWCLAAAECIREKLKFFRSDTQLIERRFGEREDIEGPTVVAEADDDRQVDSPAPASGGDLDGDQSS